jgi:uncharacterized protein (DUF1800 family)
VDERAAVAWLHRRVGWGLPADRLAAATARGVDAEVAASLAPLDAGPPLLDWDDARLPDDPMDAAGRRFAIGRWLEIMVATDRPVVDRMAWLWHGHFVSSLDKVRIGRLMVDQVRLLRRFGLGPFPDLVAAVAVDPAMLVYLDGRDSAAAAPNENFARELMELFTLGVGQYGEADVQAGAAALTGWRLQAGGGSRFVAGRHDDTRRRYLGVDGVHDLATVVAAIAAHPALPTFIAATLAREILGRTDDATVAPLADVFRAAGLRIDALVRAVVEAGLDGAAVPAVLAPVPWLVIAQRVTGARLDARTQLPALLAAGQLPLSPPNVAGWPGGPAWFATSTVVARANLAAAIATATDDGHPVLVAADGDVDALAAALALPEPTFTDATTAALRAAASPRQRLAVALLSPEFLLS